MASFRRVALVTGGARRVGRAIVERLARDGFDVAFTFHTSDPDPLVQTLDTLNSKAIAIEADLTQPHDAVERIASEFRSSFDRLDVLVNNASAFESVSGGSDSPQTDLDVMRKLNAIHFESPLLLCERFESFLRESRGHVINMIDLLAERPTKRFLLYSASKAALANLTVSLASAMAPEVTVNGISPGVVEWTDDYPQKKRDKYLNRVPLRRPGTPEDVAELVHFLATAAPYVTGQIIRLDGGRSIT